MGEKLTCPACGQQCLQVIAKLTVLVDQDENGLFIDTEITNEMFSNHVTLDGFENGTIRVSRDELAKRSPYIDPEPVVVCHSDECGGIEYKYSDAIRGEEVRVENKSW